VAEAVRTSTPAVLACRLNKRCAPFALAPGSPHPDRAINTATSIARACEDVFRAAHHSRFNKTALEKGEQAAAIAAAPHHARRFRLWGSEDILALDMAPHPSRAQRDKEGERSALARPVLDGASAPSELDGGGARVTLKLQGWYDNVSCSADRALHGVEVGTLA
jgi:hypothetical protein